MSIWKNGKLVAGGRQTTPLLSFMWADHILDDISWLRADTFSWQNGAVYQAVYQHLVDDIDGKTAQTETVAGITISFYLADDKHKITTDESAVAQIYAATGVAWYYIIDTVNEQFKLPRGKHNKYAATLGVVGNGMTTGWTDGTSFGGTDQQSLSSSYRLASGDNDYGKAVGVAHTSGNLIGQDKTIGITPDPTKSGIIAQQEQDTDQYKYLYFYVGNFTQTALENTAGITAETLNDKADIAAVTGLIMPDYARAVDTGLPTYPTSATTATYTCPSNGWFNLLGSRGDASGYTLTVTINGIVVATFPAFTTNYANMFMPVSKGDVIKYVSDNASQTWFVGTKRFIPCKGN